MPVVPTRGRPSTPGAVAAPLVDTRAVAGGATARRKQQIAESVGQSAAALTGVFMDAKNKADDIRVKDTMNKYQLVGGKLKNEYEGIQPDKALDAMGEESLVLPEYYSNKFKTAGDEMSSKLTPDQRKLFDEQRATVDNAFYLGAERKYNESFITYSKNVAEGALAINMEAGAANSDSSDEILGEYLAKAQVATVDLLTANGDLAPESKRAALAEVTSKFWANAINAELSKNVIGTAKALMDKHGKSLSLQDKLSLNKTFTGLAEKKKAQDIVADVNKIDAVRIANEEALKLQRVVDAGNLQSTPLPPDISKYANVEEMIMAANIGVEDTDKAISEAKKEGKPLISFAPKADVDKILSQINQYHSAAAIAPIPTVEEWVNGGLAKLKADVPDASPTLVALTTKGLEDAHKRKQQSRKQITDRVVDGAMRIMEEANGDINAVPPPMKEKIMELAPKELASLARYGDTIQGLREPEFNSELYVTWTRYPEIMARMSDGEFTREVTNNFPESDRKAIIKIRADQISGVGAESPDSINSKAFKTTMDNALSSVGINPSPRKTKTSAMKKVANINRFMRSAVLSAQAVRGKPFNEVELTDFINRTLATTAESEGFFGGIDEEPIIDINYGDIPKKTAAGIETYLVGQGYSMPTEADVLRLYRLSTVVEAEKRREQQRAR